MSTYYILNGQFKVIPHSNEIVTLADQSVKRIEPRIMEVLKLLLSNPNKLIERKRIIAEVWQDYGGAEESLNQAISYLRKILDVNIEEAEPSFIETITKKGYRMNAPVEIEDSEHPHDPVSMNTPLKPLSVIL